MAITASTVPGSSRVTWRRLGIPALLTRMSTEPSSSVARAARASTAVVSARSVTHIADAGEWARHRASTSASRSRPAGADPDHGAPSGELLGQAGADARRRPGHQDPLALQLQPHVPLLPVSTLGRRRAPTPGQPSPAGRGAPDRAPGAPAQPTVAIPPSTGITAPVR